MLIQINETHVVNPDHIAHIRIIGDTLKIYFDTGHFDDIKISIDEFLKKIGIGDKIVIPTYTDEREVVPNGG